MDDILRQQVKATASNFLTRRMQKRAYWDARKKDALAMAEQIGQIEKVIPEVPSALSIVGGTDGAA